MVSFPPQRFAHAFDRMHFYHCLQYGWVRDAFLNYRCLNESSTYRRDVDVLSTRFRKRYFAELDEVATTWRPLIEAARGGNVTLLYSTHDTEHNNALALQEYLETKFTT